MSDVLILGGTGWLSGRVASEWVARGARVTCLARGARAAPDGTVLVAGDRARPGAYEVLARQEWDEVVDVSSDPGHVASALDVLARHARHWTYVSSLSVYADDGVPGADESAPLAEPARPGDPYDYARAKSAAERAVRDAIAERAAVVRPGLIVGQGDPTDRFGYWVGRFALAGSSPVLVPGDARRCQVIDVEDLARFLVGVGERADRVVANATGESTPLAEVLDAARAVGGHTGDVVAVADADLLAHDVTYWMGPRSLPLWLPADMPGFATRSVEVYERLGGRYAPLTETLARALDHERALGLDRARRAGLTRAEELAVIDALSV